MNFSTTNKYFLLRSIDSNSKTPAPGNAKWRNTSEKEKTNCGWNFFHLDLRWGDWSSGPKHKHLFEAISVRNRFTPPVPKEEDVEEDEEEGDNDIAPVHDEEGEDDEEEDENSEEGSQEPGTEDHEHEEHNSEEEGVDEEEKEEEESDLFPTSFNETDFSSNNSTDDDIIDVVRKKY